MNRAWTRFEIEDSAADWRELPINGAPDAKRIERDRRASVRSRRANIDVLLFRTLDDPFATAGRVIAQGHGASFSSHRASTPGNLSRRDPRYGRSRPLEMQRSAERIPCTE